MKSVKVSETWCKRYFEIQLIGFSFDEAYKLGQNVPFNQLEDRKKYFPNLPEVEFPNNVHLTSYDYNTKEGILTASTIHDVSNWIQQNKTILNNLIN